MLIEQKIGGLVKQASFLLTIIMVAIKKRGGSWDGIFFIWHRWWISKKKKPDG